jgi:simple sugar transport system substrate-binding protein
MYAVDAGSTEGVGKTMAANKLREKGIHAGGFDLLPTTLDAISKGDLDFTIEQQPYLQDSIPSWSYSFTRSPAVCRDSRTSTQV